ncbi:MAG: hypothetical protein MKZ57_03720, partial [Candidatus Poseidoniaceae archaeon]|nr:hypothetical protein [Candidatus Poseidoniaceae archaeon]
RDDVTNPIGSSSNSRTISECNVVFNMLKCGLVQEGLSSMEESDGNYSDPPQGAYYFVYALSIILLGVAMFAYPLW